MFDILADILVVVLGVALIVLGAPWLSYGVEIYWNWCIKFQKRGK